MKVSHKIQRIRKSECGINGLTTHIQSASHMICGSQTCTQNNESTLSVHLPLLSEEGNFLDQTRNSWLLQQSKRPWQNWVRSLGQIWGTTPHLDLDRIHYTHYLPDNLKECGT
jgi:hypothetical protein